MAIQNTDAFQVAVVQASPVLFDLKATMEKTGGLVKEATENGARVILFPEVFLSGYPRGMGFGTLVGGRTPEGRELYYRLWQNAVEVPGKQTEELAAMAKKHKCYLIVGVTEKDRITDTLYCSLLYFSPQGKLLHKHRKIKPTAAERIIWGEGKGDDLNVIDTPLGKMGGLICWENYMPLARYALYEQGIHLYFAPTADCRDTWQSTMEHIACEGRCFVFGANQYLQKSDYPEDLQQLIDTSHPSLPSSGGSVIVSPLGKTLAGPLYDREGILYATIDLKEIVKAKMDFDVVGHYSRPDVFDYSWKAKK